MHPSALSEVIKQRLNVKSRPLTSCIDTNGFINFPGSVIGAAEWTVCHLRGRVRSKLPGGKVLIMICNGAIVDSREGEEI